jgi:RimJ/RimL family protein N-acetyltransferase
MAAMRSHPESRRYIRFVPTKSTSEDVRASRIERSRDEARVEFYIHTATTPPRLVGGTGIFHVNDTFKSCQVGIMVSPDKHRTGIATDALYTVLEYAFGERGMHRATFETAVDNVGMRGWLDGAGAKLEGTQRECWPDGAGGYTDACVYSILDWEWKEIVKAKLEARINRAS